MPAAEWTGTGSRCTIPPGDSHHPMVSRVSVRPKSLMNALNGLLKKNRLLAVSKADMLDDELEEAMRAEIEDLHPIFFSSVAQQGLQQLKDRIWQSMESATVW